MGEVIQGNFPQRPPDTLDHILDGVEPTAESMERLRQQFAEDQASVAHLPDWLQPIEMLERIRNRKPSFLDLPHPEHD